MDTKKKIAYGLLALGTIIFAISLFNIPTTNIVGLVVGAGLGYTGFYLNRKG